MKTTLNLPDELFREAKKAAVDRNVTLTQFFETAVRHELAGQPVKPFKLKDGSFMGEPGVQPGIDLSNWDQIRDLIYEGRGS